MIFFENVKKKVRKINQNGYYIFHEEMFLCYIKYIHQESKMNKRSGRF